MNKKPREGVEVRVRKTPGAYVYHCGCPLSRTTRPVEMKEQEAKDLGLRGASVADHHEADAHHWKGGPELTVTADARVARPEPTFGSGPGQAVRRSEK